jgi:uncharacterized spore protein YtfJ
MSNALFTGRGQFIGQLAEKLGTTTTVKTVYGDPIERGAVTIIPVAKILYGFGGGEGDKNGQGGAGGGGGMKVTPIGYIELKNGETKFRPIRDSAATIALMVAGGFAGALFMYGLRSLFPLNRRDSQLKKIASES